MTTADAAPVRTGAEILADRGFDVLQGLRVGLVANRATHVRGRPLLDLLVAAPGVEVVAIFSPEHGFDGTAAAGASVADGIERRTQVRVHSLYGRTRRPTPEMLRGIDILVFDIQDVGARVFTYISTLGLVMQAAAEAQLPVLVLDRPNPLGGQRVSGFVREDNARSFVGAYRIPLIHGLTVGELARMVAGMGLIDGLGGFTPSVIWMEGWRRNMLWPDTGLPWVPPSPNLPTFQSALVYPGTVLFEATRASEGRGTPTPFTWVGMPGVDGRRVAENLQSRRLPGLRFLPEVMTPRAQRGAAPNPKHKGVRISGVRIAITDARRVEPAALGPELLAAFAVQANRRGRRLVDRPDFLRLLAGTDRLYRQLQAATPPDRIAAGWRSEAAEFNAQRQRWLYYPD